MMENNKKPKSESEILQETRSEAAKSLKVKFGLSIKESSLLVGSFNGKINFTNFKKELAKSIKSGSLSKKSSKKLKEIFNYLKMKFGYIGDLGVHDHHDEHEKKQEEKPKPFETPSTAYFKKNIQQIKNKSSGKDDYAQTISKHFIESIQNNNAPWMKPWKASEYLMPQNPVTGTVYNGLNSLYLEALQLNKYQSSDPRWLTFNNIKEQNFQLEKGSKGSLVTYFTKLHLDSDGKAVDRAGEGVKTKSIMKHYYVFHASNIKGLPEHKPDAITEAQNKQIIANAQAILDNSQSAIFHDSPDRNYYSRDKDEIHLTPKSSFAKLDDYYSTALHELAHWTGHPSRLNREFGDNKRSPQYAQEELRAEIASYMLCKELKLDFNPQNSEAYVSSWCKQLSNASNELFKASKDANAIKTFCESFMQAKQLPPVDINNQNINNSNNNASARKGR